MMSSEENLSILDGLPETFALKERISSTDCCESYFAFDRVKKKRFVVKRFKRDKFVSEEHKSLFFAECESQKTRRISAASSSILNVQMYGQDADWLWTAREALTDAKTLEDLVKTGRTMRPLDISKRFSGLCQLLSGLHKTGQIHRNLKPSNIFIVGADGFALCDADVAHFLDPAIMAACGNSDFLAPEQKNAGVADEKTDVWCVGALIAYAVSGKTPADFEISFAPKELHEIIAKSLQKEQSARYNSVDELKDELLRLQKIVRESVFSTETAVVANETIAPAISDGGLRDEYIASSPALSAFPQQASKIVCPQCNTPISVGARLCPHCKRPYEEPCLNCQSFNPFWLKHCRGCSSDLLSLKQKMSEKLHTQQQQIMKFREMYAHEKAQMLVKIMSQMTHPDFQSYRDWAKNMLPIVQKERRDIRNYLDGVRAHAKNAMTEQQYERVIQIVEQVPRTLVDEELRKLHSTASECIVEVESLIREIRNAIVTQQYASLLSTVQRYSELKANDPEARALQKKIEKLTTVTLKGGSKLRRIPAGKFYMGSHDSDSFSRNNERPQHKVTLSRSLLVGIYPVTQEEFARLMGFNPSTAADNPRCPVDNVTWFSALEYCNKLSEEEGLPLYYQLDNVKRRNNSIMIERAEASISGGDGFRLLTEAEWEYACRSGTITPWHFGDLVLDAAIYAWYFDNSQNETHPVGEKKPNSWGLYDMHGNTMEWTFDWFSEFYYQQCGDITDPLGPETGTTRVLRGGAWQFGAEATRSPYRNSSNPEASSSVVGFRIVRNAAEDNAQSKQH